MAVSSSHAVSVVRSMLPDVALLAGLVAALEAASAAPPCSEEMHFETGLIRCERGCITNLDKSECNVSYS